MAGKRAPLTVTLIALGVAISCGVALFVSVAAASCDPLEASWIDGAWLPLLLLSSAGIALASGLSMRYLSERPASSAASVGMGCFVFVLAAVLLLIPAFVYALARCD